MTEATAQERVRELVGPAGYDRLARLAQLIVAENDKQNLVARSTIDAIWSRHILDSVQLIQWANTSGQWLDIGTGGGFPGLAIAAASDAWPMLLVEPRRLRAEFLVRAADDLGLDRVAVAQSRVEAVNVKATNISARAVALIEKLLQAAGHCATPTTRWLFLRGRVETGEIARLRMMDGTLFHVEQSLSDPASSVVIATGRGAGR